MKEENYLEGIYGCLERIEKKGEILSSAPVDKNNAVTGGETGIAMLREIRDGLERDLNGIRTSFSQYAGTLLAVSKSMQDVSGRNPLPDRTAEILAGIRKTGEQTSEEIKAVTRNFAASLFRNIKYFTLRKLYLCRKWMQKRLQKTTTTGITLPNFDFLA